MNLVSSSLGASAMAQGPVIQNLLRQQQPSHYFSENDARVNGGGPGPDFMSAAEGPGHNWNGTHSSNKGSGMGGPTRSEAVRAAAIAGGVGMGAMYAGRHNISDSNGSQRATQAQRLGEVKEEAKFIGVLGQQAAGRGVAKTQESPAQMNGQWPQNPQFFGVQKKSAVPYQKIVADGNNLHAVLNGFAETRRGGAMPSDTANIIAGVQRRQSLISEAFNTKKNESIYTGVPRSAAVNLYHIELKNTRENDLYSFY